MLPTLRVTATSCVVFYYCYNLIFIEKFQYKATWQRSSLIFFRARFGLVGSDQSRVETLKAKKSETSETKKKRIREKFHSDWNSEKKRKKWNESDLKEIWKESLRRCFAAKVFLLLLKRSVFGFNSTSTKKFLQEQVLKCGLKNIERKVLKM